MVNNNHKSGFSLFEACVVMLIVGIFTALCASSFSKRHITYQESDGHGRYECYRNSAGNIMQRYVENNNSRSVTGTTCVFRPPRYAKYVLLNAIGGGSAGDAGKFKSIFYNAVDSPLTVEPGVANANTYIKTSDGNTILTAEAGDSDMVATNSAADTVESCTFTYTKYNCNGATPICRQDGLYLSVSFCNGSDFVTQYLLISDVKEHRTSYSGDTLTYKDLSDYTSHGVEPEDAVNLINTDAYETFYTISVKFDLTMSSVSQMESYLKALSIEDGIASANPGRPGNPGGVVILW